MSRHAARPGLTQIDSYNDEPPLTATHTQPCVTR